MTDVSDYKFCFHRQVKILLLHWLIHTRLDVREYLDFMDVKTSRSHMGPPSLPPKFFGALSQGLGDPEHDAKY
jgi:hypothetical protein